MPSSGVEFALEANAGPNGKRKKHPEQNRQTPADAELPPTDCRQSKSHKADRRLHEAARHARGVSHRAKEGHARIFHRQRWGGLLAAVSVRIRGFSDLPI